MVALDKKQIAAVTRLKKRADALELEREDSRKGENSIYRKMQPWERPHVSTLINQRIDMLYNIADTDRDDEKVLRWCQGEVVEVYAKKNREQKVRILWDPLPNVVEYHDFTESDEILVPKLWNIAKAVEGAWRMDIDIDAEIDNDDVDIDQGGDAAPVMLDRSIVINSE